MNSILGSVLVIIGLYVLLWGKSNDKQDQAAEEDDADHCHPVLSTQVIPVTKQPMVSLTNSQQF